MRKKLAVLFALVLVSLTFLGSPPPSKADLCDTMFGCRLKRSVDMAECVCDAMAYNRTCTICCIDHNACCWSGTLTTEPSWCMYF
jgi:hypothetical protein